MAARRTRLKYRRESTSTVSPKGSHKRRSVTLQTNGKKTSTPSGPKRNKLTSGSKSKINTQPKSAQKQKTPAKTKRTGVKTVNVTRIPKDEYEFDGTDDFVSGDSFLSKSSNSKKTSKRGEFTSIVSSKRSEANIQKSKQQKHKDKNTKQIQEKKKTSTPVESTSAVNIKRGKGRIFLTKELQVSLPRLDFDMSITPIPISTPHALKRKTRRSSEAKTVSFVDDSKSSPKLLTTPLLPAVKSGHRNVPRTKIPKADGSRPSVSAEKKPVSVTSAQVSSVKTLKKTGQKRQNPQSQNSTDKDTAEVDNVPTKRRKVDLPSSQPISQVSKKKLLGKGANTTKHQKQSSRKQIPSKQSKLPFAPRTSPRQHKPVTSTPIISPDEQSDKVQHSDMVKMCNTPQVYDSGISMGDDMAFSREAESSAVMTHSLPGFMEDEPLQSQSLELSSSPLSGPNAHSRNDPESSLNRKSGIQYKPGKTKREKGRFSTSRVDAWASAMNQSLEDVESFELVVE